MTFYNTLPKQQRIPIHRQYGMRLERRRHWIYDALIFAIISVIAYYAIHIGMNFSAYRQIYTHRYNKLESRITSLYNDIIDTDMSANSLIKPVSITLPTPAKEPVQVIESSLEIALHKPLEPLPKMIMPSKDVLKHTVFTPADNRIVLPSIGKSVPLINVPSDVKTFEELESVIQEGLQSGIVVHPISPETPLQVGNMVLTGHSSYYNWDKGRFKDVFALLHDVAKGDEVKVYYNNSEYKYKIEDITVVNPEQVEVLEQPSDSRELTLITCTPVGTNKQRLIVKAMPV